MTLWEYLIGLWQTYGPSLQEWAYSKGWYIPMLLAMGLVLVARAKKGG